MFNRRPFRRFRALSRGAGLALLCLLLPLAHAQQTAPAQDRWYDVELLIFRYANPEEFSAENWPDRWLLPATANSVDLYDIDRKYLSDFKSLDLKARNFGGMLEKLEKSVRYEFLNSSAWRQRGLSREQAVGVRVRAGRAYVPQTPIMIDADFGLFEEGFVEQGFSRDVTIRRYVETQAKSGPVLHELEGEIKIVLSRYLHVYTDLLLLKPVTLTPAQAESRRTPRGLAAGGAHNPISAYTIDWTKPAAGAILADENNTLYGFNIKAHRRMRSGELHYLDHPLLGILIQIKPTETKP
jgi:hypothetical protein